MAIYSRKLSVSITKRVSDISKYLAVLAIDCRKPSYVNKEKCFYLGVPLRIIENLL